VVAGKMTLYPFGYVTRFKINFEIQNLLSQAFKISNTEHKAVGNKAQWRSKGGKWGHTPLGVCRWGASTHFEVE